MDQSPLVGFQPASSASLLVFQALVAVLIGVFLGLVQRHLERRAFRRVATGTALYLGMFGVLVLSNQLWLHKMPLVPLTFTAIFLVSIGFVLSPSGRRLAEATPFVLLVAVQGFRLPLELILHNWAESGTIPQTLTFQGQNFDIVSGTLALILAPFAGRSQTAAWLANGVGMVLLINVMRVAIFSMPLPFAWAVQPELRLIFLMPYAWIGPICVGGAWIGHGLLTRKLLQR